MGSSVVMMVVMVMMPGCGERRCREQDHQAKQKHFLHALDPATGCGGRNIDFSFGTNRATSNMEDEPPIRKQPGRAVRPAAGRSESSQEPSWIISGIFLRSLASPNGFSNVVWVRLFPLAA